MLQRIQTIFLFLVITLLLSAMFFPIWVSAEEATGEVHKLMYSGHYHTLANGEIIKEMTPYAVLGILAIFSIILALVEILQFKNRVLQMKIGMANTFFLLINLSASLYFTYTEAAWVLSKELPYGLGIFLLMGAIVFNQLANKFIRRDENLVRSVDRIR